MKKEIRKMYAMAIVKIVFALVLGAVVAFVFVESGDLDEVAIIVCGVLWGIAVLIYLISGILTLKNGKKQFTRYTEKTGYNIEQLDEEYRSSLDHERVHIGKVHMFANASDGFFVLPLEDIEKIYVRHYNTSSGGYYYLYVCTKDIDKIKMYYLVGSHAREALDALASVCPNAEVDYSL